MANIATLQDISFMLENIKWINRDENKLSKKQQRKISSFSDEEQKKIKEDILSHKKEENKILLNFWIMALQEKLRSSGLPKEIVSRIHELITTAKNGSNIRNIESEVEDLKGSISEEERKEAAQEEKKSEDVFVDETGFSDIMPFIHVRYTKEKYEKAAQEYFKNKILPRFIEAAEKPIVPVEVKREYPQKKGSMLPKADLELKQQNHKEWMEKLAETLQKEQAKAGKPIQTNDEIVAFYENMTPAQQRNAINVLKQNYSALARQQEEKQKIQDQLTLQKGIERLRRKHQAKETKRPKRRARLAKENNPQKPSTRGITSPKLRHPQTKIRKTIEPGVNKGRNDPKNEDNTGKGLLDTFRQNKEKHPQQTHLSSKSNN